MLKTIALGVDDFKKIIDRECFYVDKTLLIKHIIDDRSDVCLITRPRRFGKTLSLSMLKYYFDINLDSKDLFEGLDIMSCDEKYISEMNSCPVIFLTLKSLKYSDYETNIINLKSYISNIYKEHLYLLNSNKLLESEKETISRIIDNKIYDSEISNLLYDLSGYLYKHFDKNVLMLIDEYDVPLQNAYVNNFYNEAITFWKNFFDNSFKTNPYLYKTVLTGVSRVAKESIFSGANNFTVYSVMQDNTFSSDFGFTHEEVKKILKDCDLSEALEDVQKWYDGYKIGDANNLYNPWSVLNFLKNNSLMPYWVNTSSNDIIKMILKNSTSIKLELEKLLACEEVTVRVEEEMILDNIEANENNVWGLLIGTGYLKVTNQIDYRYASVAIPNYEIKSLFEDIIDSWFGGYVSGQNLNTLLNSLVKLDYESFIAYFKQITLEMFSSWDVGINTSENFYHAFVLGLMVGLKDKYYITSNRESGYGRYDVVLKAKDKENPSFIMEFKVVRNTFEESIEEAKNQIIEKCYETSLVNEGYTKIEKMVFAFQGKDVEIEVF